MEKRLSKVIIHLGYWVFVIIVLTLVFGSSWGNNVAAFFFVCMLLPIVMGTSYFINYVLVPKFYLKKRKVMFFQYVFYSVIVSLYFEAIVLLFSFIYLGNFSFQNLAPNASDTVLLGVILYLLVFVGTGLLMYDRIKENQKTIRLLLDENKKMKKAVIEVISNRVLKKISFDDILYIESFSDYVIINTLLDKIKSKERISKLSERLPTTFIRIHRSFIINKVKVSSISFDKINIGNATLNIGRSYKKEVMEAIKDQNMISME